MVISSNTLFHFTDSIHNLLNILTLEFRPRYCLEDFVAIFSSHPRLKKIGVPMVSFCDLPLSTVGEHLKCYGNYGIGMTKEWGLKNGLNPVIYLCPRSNLAKYFENLLKAFLRKGNNAEWNIFYEIVSFIKTYKGDMDKNGNKYPNKNFYDEKEWRYVPKIKFYPDELYRLTEEEFLDEKNRELASNELGQKYKLSFEPNDIKYIIVEKDEQVLGMIDAIHRIKGKYDLNTKRLLSSRAISTKQILEDF